MTDIFLPRAFAVFPTLKREWLIDDVFTGELSREFYPTRRYLQAGRNAPHENFLSDILAYSGEWGKGSY